MKHTRPAETITANTTLSKSDSGKTLIAGAVDLVVTLPDADEAGVYFAFVTKSPSAGTGLSLSPQAADKINGGTVDKDLINSGASDAAGDAVELVSDGAGGWWTRGKVGTWAAEA